MLLRLLRDRSGSALIEYTTTISIVLLLFIVVVAVAGNWVSGEWARLLAALPA
jgi:Flp pilus assembly pilin Flp